MLAQRMAAEVLEWVPDFGNTMIHQTIERANEVTGFSAAKISLLHE